MKSYPRFTLCIAALSLAVASFAYAIRDVGAVLYDRAASWLDTAFAMFKPNRLALAGEGYSDIALAGGAPLDRALQNDMRHESGVPRRSADRHT